MISHLIFHKLLGIVDSFRFPSFCRMMYRSNEKTHNTVVTLLYKAMIGLKSESPAEDHKKIAVSEGLDIRYMLGDSSFTLPAFLLIFR